MTIALAVWGRFEWSEVAGLISRPRWRGVPGGRAPVCACTTDRLPPRKRARGVMRGETGSIVTAMCYGEYYPNPGELAASDEPWSDADWDEYAAAGAASRRPSGRSARHGDPGPGRLRRHRRRNTGRAAGLPRAGLHRADGGRLISIIAPLTQACFNPARDFGPRLFTFLAGWGTAALPGPNGTGFFTVYILAPILGAVAGGGVYELRLRPALSPRRTGHAAWAMTRIEPMHDRKQWTIANCESAICNCCSASLAAALLRRRQPPPPSRSIRRCPTRPSSPSPVTYDVDFSVVVTPPYHTQVLKVWLPLPQSDAAQEVERRRVSQSSRWRSSRRSPPSRLRQPFAYFEFDDPQGAQIIRHRFRVKVWELRWNLDAAQGRSRSKEWPAAFDRIAAANRRRCRSMTAFASCWPRSCRSRDGPLGDLSAVMDWVSDHLKYDHHDASLRADSQHACSTSSAATAATITACAPRWAGRWAIPTRVTYGINPFPKNSPSHCKLEAFLPPYGWVSFDVSETQKLIAADSQGREARRQPRRSDWPPPASDRLLERLPRQHLVLQTRGTDYDLAPPASRKVPVVRTIYAEADGVAAARARPGRPEKREFAWMTVHKYTPDREVTYPFKDFENPDP